jgi:hypothetical protein
MNLWPQHFPKVPPLTVQSEETVDLPDWAAPLCGTLDLLIRTQLKRNKLPRITPTDIAG